MTFYVYEWQAWDGFVLPTIFPEAHRFEAYPCEYAEDVLSRIAPDMTCFAFHINLSDTNNIPFDRAFFCESLQKKGIQIINQNATDMCKRTLHHICRRVSLPISAADRNGSGDEILIIKSNNNHGGESEEKLSPEQRIFLGIESNNPNIRAATSYAIVPRSHVPSSVWTEPGTIVERYISNKDNYFYRCFRLLSKLVIQRASSFAPQKKMDYELVRDEWYIDLSEDQPVVCKQPECVSSRQTEDLLTVLTKFTQICPADFYSFDMMQDDNGQLFIVDINFTPFGGTTDKDTNAITFLREAAQELRL